MKPSDKYFLDRWEQTRKQGRGRYVLTTGMLAWGLPILVLLALLPFGLVIAGAVRLARMILGS